MAILNSNNYKIAIVKETTYGQQVKGIVAGGGLYFDGKLERNRTPVTVDLVKKNNNLAESEDMTKVTAEMVTATWTGDLTDGHEILLQAYFDDTASPYTHPAHLGTPHSYNIYQLYLNSVGAVTHYDVLLGCALPSLSFHGESTGIWQFTANIEAASMRQMVVNASGDAITTAAGLPVLGSPFLFGDTTALTPTGSNKILSASIDLAKTMVDAKHRYQNSLYKTNDRYTGIGGTLSFEEEWDGTNNANDQAYLFNEGAANTIITLANAAKTWTFALYGVFTEASRPDADKNLFVGNYTQKLTMDAGLTAPVTVTVASA